ncbi:LLM class F420-dependent oxidoreductase [Amycolatopsis sp. WAC 01375]|uniref:LLM class F420-dependent oxidoreductase n=1 Tax=Amycolatopsis sp. WAC 01375 TaxID=2203194 RepID=UPI000F7B19A6|nr:LLM class F420-dependent oxidoreductase [Amycolatopsis sp. WAC 01375]RSM75019.1 LLM class F420-dependent oxidoreductase [Amycolatopsis sp. WAC 01375]
MDFGIATSVTDEGIRPHVLAAALEEKGFASLYLPEHSHIPVSRESPYPGGELPRGALRNLDPFVALAAAATVTSTLRLGTAVALMIQRDVLYTAKEIASLDLLSNGRVIFGVGAGWNIEEMRNHGVEPRTRGALLTEQLQALKEIWTRDEAEFHGKHIDFDPVYSWPKPVRKPHPPIYVAGQGPAGLKRLAEHADGWLPHSVTPPEELRRGRSWLADQGREDVRISVFGAPADPGLLRRLAAAGADEVSLTLPTLPEAETLERLDELAKTIEPLR